MTLVRVLWRLLVLSATAAAFVGLIAMYYEITPRTVFSAAMIRAMGPAAVARNLYEASHEPSAPAVGYFSQFVGYGIMLAVFCYAGRMLFRLRLNPAPRSEGQLVLLGLHETRRDRDSAAIIAPGVQR